MFIATIKIVVRNVINMVDVTLRFNGKNINRINIKNIIKEGIFSSSFIIDRFLFINIKVKLPNPISQKRKGIKKYVADWFTE